MNFIGMVNQYQFCKKEGGVIDLTIHRIACPICFNISTVISSAYHS